MRRYLIFFVALCTSLSCAKTELETENGVSNTKFYYAETPAGEAKTYIDTDYDIHWTADDRISVFCSPANEQYRFTGATGAQRGTFENMTEPATPTFSRNYAVYPYQSGNTSVSEGTMTVSFPSEQSYANNSFGLGANTMVAVTESLADDKFKFRNCCGYLMLKLYGGDKIKSITLRGNSGEKIAGAATITAEYGKDPTIAMADDATTEVSLTCPAEGVPTKESSGQFTQFWITLPPTTFSNGFTVEITNTEDNVISRSTSNSITINRNKILKMAPVKVDSQNSKDLLSFSLSDGVNTYKAFDISDGYVNVQVPNGTDMTNMTATFEHNGVSVKVNGVPQTSGADSHDFSDFVHPVTYVVTSKAGTSQSYIIRMFNLPIVFINTKSKQELVDRETWIDCSISILEEKGNIEDYGSAGIKGRGNYSWDRSQKKPFNIKFSQKPKKDILGMPRHKKWCMINIMGNCYFSDYLGFNISQRAEHIGWTPHCIFVELFMNGTHRGLYNLVEKIEIDENRVNITEMSSSDIDDEKITGGYLLTYDTTFDEVNKFHSQYFNMPVMFKEPDEDVLVPEQFNYIKDYINNFEASLKDNNRFANGEYLNYIDINSFIDAWFIKELCGRSLGGPSSDFSGPRSVYFHKERGDVLKAGPMWDFNPFVVIFDKTFYCKDGQYYKRLFTDNFFVSRVKEKWPDFKSNVEGNNKYPSIITVFHEINDAIKYSAKRDSEMWNGTWTYMTIPYETHFENIDNGLLMRLNWMDTEIKKMIVKYDSIPGGNEDVDVQEDKSGDFNFGF